MYFILCFNDCYGTTCTRNIFLGHFCILGNQECNQCIRVTLLSLLVVVINATKFGLDKVDINSVIFSYLFCLAITNWCIIKLTSCIQHVYITSRALPRRYTTTSNSTKHVF